MLDVTPRGGDSPEVAELTALLNLVPGLPRYELVGGGVPAPHLHPGPPSAGLRLVTRSTAQACVYLANGVGVPPEHVECGLAQVAVDEEGKVFDGREATAGSSRSTLARGASRLPTPTSR